MVGIPKESPTDGPRSDTAPSPVIRYGRSEVPVASGSPTQLPEKMMYQRAAWQNAETASPENRIAILLTVKVYFRNVEKFHNVCPRQLCLLVYNPH